MINRLRSWIRAFFGISTRETNGLLLLLPLLLISVFVIPAYQRWRSTQPIDFTDNQRKLDSLLAHWPTQKDSAFIVKDYSRFPFDPNTASLADLDSLGFPDFLAQRILNYRSKNGKFRKKADLLRIYGMDTSFYEDLEPFIQLPTQVASTALIAKETAPTAKAEFVREWMDINTADSVQLTKIYGIGAKLSERIINYRAKLGGFVSMEQLYEVYGLDTVVIQRMQQKYFVDSLFQPKKIFLNQASIKELSSHPYINYTLARAITTYRFQHGKFATVDEVKKIALVDETFYSKILPYLSLNP